MELPEGEIRQVEQGALLHDIGKIATPDAILLKPGPLSDEEWETMKKHPEIGYRILSTDPYMEKVAEIVHQHQESYDGSGYPQGLKGEEICLGARIFAVVDAYDAIRSERAYSGAQSADYAVKEIRRNSGVQFDPLVVDALVACLPEIETAGDWTSP